MSQTYSIAEQSVVAAPPSTAREVALDVARWPQIHPSAVHVECLERTENSDLLQYWSVLDEHTVRTWRARRRVADFQVRFAQEPPEAPFASAAGGWSFEPVNGGETLVTRFEEFMLRDDARITADEARENVLKDCREDLAALRYAAEDRDALEQLTVSFEDPLFIVGAVKDAYDYLYEAEKWPARLPHVTRLVLDEEVPNIQFFDMDTVSADNSRHTTRSVRICLPQHKIVYKQLQPPKTMDAHTGHWEFAEAPEGLVATARHTATIKPSGLHLFGDGTTVEHARRCLRRVLSANSMENLRLAKAYAEARAGF
ncbi:aromatase/cyclase [Amycolatopsis sp. NPDC003676]